MASEPPLDTILESVMFCIRGLGQRMNIIPKINIVAILVIIWVACAFPAMAGPFEDAMASYAEKDYDKALPLLTPLAEAGNDDAQYYLGEMYEYGRGVKWSDEQAFYWYMKSAKAGNAQAQNTVADLYYLGASGVKQNRKTAFKWFLKAAKNNHAEAQNNLAFAYQIGTGTTKNLKKAMEWYKRAASQGHNPSRVQMGLMFEEGYGGWKDYNEAGQYYRAAAKFNDPQGLYELGRLKENGLGVERDLIEAQKLYKQSFDAGYKLAENEYDRITAIIEKEHAEHLEGMKTDIERQLIAEQQEKERQLKIKKRQDARVAKALSVGTIESGMKAFRAKDYQRAFPILNAHAEANNAQAQTAVGLMYSGGTGVELDYETAANWFKKAGDNKSGEALFYYSNMARKHLVPLPNAYISTYKVAEEALQKSVGLGYQPAIDYTISRQMRKEDEAVAENERQARWQQERLQKAAEGAETDLERRIREKKKYDDSIDDIQLGRCRNPKYYTVNGQQRVSCD